ncbi:hypothetical protein PVAND_011248 [Polypedilum vanderplanki]|uniref:Cytochrome P450 n=1 Tax=Polypedilum vanderplanki TaxID=319348 RepID=A0A9J6CIW4_POLVA|nr:hypothetical protein PVAND_011248 [Polypedilum vanderplanki]
MTVLEQLIFATIAFLVISVLIFYWRRKRLYNLADKIPGENGLPFLGVLHKFTKSDLNEYHKEIMKLILKNKPISKTWFGPQFVILTEDAECIHKILNSSHTQNKPSYFYKGMMIDEGLLAINGHQYDKHRKILNKSFTPNMLQKFIPTFNEKSRVCMMNLSKRLSSDEAFDIFKYVGACTLDSFISGHYNYDQNFYDSDLVKIIEESRSLVMKKVVRPWYNIKILFKNSSLRHQMEYYYERLLRILNDIKTNNLQNPNTKLPDLVLNLLMKSKNNFTEEEIRDEMITFIYAGYETTAISLSSILLMLAMHKDVQQKVIDEIDEIVSSNEEISNETLLKFSYVELVIKESLRLFPAAGITGRQSTEEIELADYTIPKGTLFVLSIFDMQRSSKYWGDDALQFNPDRFLPENIENVNSHAYVPFSGGKRICIGWKYSMIFMKIFLIHFFKNYTIDTKQEFKDINFDIIPLMIISQGYMINIQKRQK